MDIIFNSLNLNDAVNYFVENSNHEDVATQEVDVQKIARTNESVFLRKNYGTRVMKMKVIVKEIAITSYLNNLKPNLENFKNRVIRENRIMNNSDC